MFSSETPSSTPPDREQDNNDLRRLARVAYLVGGLNALGSSVFLFLLYRGLDLLASGNANVQTMYSDPESDKMFGRAFIVLGGGVVLVGWILGGLTVFAGRCIASRQRLVFIKRIASINGFLIPLGLLWGRSCSFALSRPSVEALFDKPSA